MQMDAMIAAVKRAEPGPTAVVIAAAGAAIICGFFFFQYVMGLPPCPLCLEQRYAYYFGVPLAILLSLGANHGASSKVLLAGFGALTVAMLWNAGLGVYHSGIEWKWWAGPTDCTGPLNDLRGKSGLLNQLQDISIVRCDQAAWRFLGLSLAGWNVLVSLAIAALAAHGFRGMVRRGALKKLA
ncbi:MAG: disulfide bond formation protein B [Pseudolabrys sp.]|nr:disulfide bond formation protein B [Pseudolabrys sp.]